VAVRALSAARAQDDSAPLSLSLRLLGQNEFMMGEFAASLAHLEQALALYDREEHAQSAQVYGLDLKSAPLKYLSLDHWMLGYPERAGRWLEEQLRHSESLGYAFNLSLSKMWGYYLLMCRRDLSAARDLATSLGILAHKHEIPDCAVAAQMQLALLEALQAKNDAVLEHASQRLEAYRRTWGEFVVPFNLGTLAAGWARVGRATRAMQLVDEALSVIEDTDERWAEAEIWRLKGHFCPPDAGHEAHACFERSLNVAREQGARSWVLRTTVSQAQLLAAEADVPAAQAHLAPVLGQFTEGLNDPDLREARCLFGNLASADS